MPVWDSTKLINSALALVGSAPIAGPDEETDLNRQVQAVFKIWLDLCLAVYPWSWGERTVKLARLPDEEPINGWAYVFDLPDDRLSDPLKVLADPKNPDIPLRRFALEEGLLYADETDLWVTFNWRVDPDFWPPVFRAAFNSALASAFALPVSQNNTLREAYFVEAFGSPSMDMRGGLMGKAIAADIRGRPGPAPLLLSPDPLTTAHGGGEWHG